MDWLGRTWIAALGLAWAASTGCASDCQVICGKLEFCNLLIETDRSGCMDRCESRKKAAADFIDICSDCVGEASCETVSNAGCSEPCAPVIGAGDPVGGGGAGGEGGAGGAGGAGGGGAGGFGGEGGGTADT